MSETVVYEIARFSDENDAAVMERMQLLSEVDLLKLRGASGDESVCDGTDIAAIIGSTPALREVHAGEEARISCVPEIVAELPFVPRPLCEVDDRSECLANVNGDVWLAFPTIGGDNVMLPGWDGGERPDMDPCWAEYQYGEGEWNPLVGNISIGLAAPGVAVAYGHYDHGGTGGDSAVAVRRFDDFAAMFVAWLRNTDLLDGLWGGDSPPGSPNVELFVEAALTEDQLFYWDTDSVREEDVDDHDDDDDENTSSVRWERLQLHLSAEQVDQVRVHLGARRPG